MEDSKNLANKMSNTLTYRDYVGSARYSAEDRVYHGRVESIRDVVTFEAKSAEELEQAFQEAVEDYLQMCREVGKRAGKTRSGMSQTQGLENPI